MFEPLDKWNWHEMLFSAENWFIELGTVLWWKCPIDEPPYAGTPLDVDFEKDYYTHFSLLPNVKDIDGEHIYSMSHQMKVIRPFVNSKS